MNYLTLDLDNGDLVLSDNSVWKSLNTWLDGGTLYSDYYDASNCGDFWVASTHWISIDSESTYLTFTIEYEFIDATATDSCLCQIKFDGFEDGGVAVTADSSGLNISTDASKHINCDYSNANIKIDITVNLLTKEITTYIHKDNEPLAKKVNVFNYSFTEFVIQAGSRGDIVYKLPTTTKLLNVSVSDVAVSYSNFPETIDYIDKLGLARIWANIKSYISSQLLGKSDTGHTHVSSDVTDLLSDTHTWTSQQSYNSDLNLNYASTDVDDIVNSVAGSATLDNFVHMTGNETVNGIKSFPDGVIANVTGSATSATNDGSGNVISTTYGKLGANNTWTGNNVFKSGLDIVEPNSLPAGIYGTAITFRDYQGNRFGYFQPYIDSDNNVNITIGADGSGMIRFNSNVIPYTSSVVNLGSSIYQWNNLYAKNYYYNGTQWGLDKNNTWTGKNQFNNHIHPGNVTGVDSCSFAFNAMYNTIFLNTRGSDNFPSYGTFLYAGYNQTGSGSPITHGQLQLLRSTDKRGETNNGEIPDTSFVMWRVSPNFLLMDMMQSVRVKNDGSVNQMIPITDSTTDLGTSSYKWKSFNGVNPGALSLPATDTTDASGDIVPPSGESSINLSGSANTFTPSNNGWLTLAINCASGNCIIVRQNTSNRETLNYMQGYVPGQTNIYLTVPVLAGVTYYVFLYATSFVMARFALCQGNV